MKKYAWEIFGASLLISAAVVYYAFTQETEKDQLSAGLLASVRISSIYFLLAFSIGPLVRLTQQSLLRAVMANRRYLGLGFAQLHSVHLAFIVLYVQANPGQVDTVTLIGGGAAFVLMYLQAATSNNFSVAKLGKYWGWLHTVAMYYLWLILTFTFSGGSSIISKTFTALLILAMLLRIFTAIRRRSSAATS